MKTNKKNKKHIAAGLALTLLVSGTFAWQSFSQEATNEIIESVGMPGGRLHDYFNGFDKDVFVENYGGADAPDVYARVRIAEYLEFGKDAGSLSASGVSMTVVDGDIANSATASITDPDTWDIYDYYATVADSSGDIRDYRTLDLGGSSVYMPTFNQDNTDKDPDVRGTYRDTNGDVKETPYDDYPNPAFVAGTSTESGTVVTADDSKADTHTAAATADATVMTMDAWLAVGAPVQDTWVFDTNGWAYYAAPIKPGTASGLLINAIEIEENPKEEWYYAVDVTAQLATAGDWGDKETSTGAEDGTGMYEDMSDEALYLLNKAAGLVTVENMTITNNGTALTATDAILSTTAITFDVDMDVINGSTNSNAQAAELAISWSVEEEGAVATAYSLGSALVQNGNKATFTATSDMVSSGSRYVITATSDLDPSKSVSITMHDGSTVEGGTPEVETPTEAQWVTDIKGAASKGKVTIDGVEWQVLEATSEAALLYATGLVGPNKAFHGTSSADRDSTWSTSDIRTYLNSDDYIDAYFPSLKASLKVTTLETALVTNASGNYETTTDKVFLLTQEDLGWNTSDSGASGTVAPSVAGALVPSGDVNISSTFWLRSPHSSTIAANVHSTGILNITSTYVTYGVRPALWVSL